MADEKLTRHVYVITKDGNILTEKSTSKIENILHTQADIKEELTFIMGEAINSPKALAKALETNPDIILMIATKDSTKRIPDKEKKYVVHNLKLSESETKTSFDVLADTFGLTNAI